MFPFELLVLDADGAGQRRATPLRYLTRASHRVLLLSVRTHSSGSMYPVLVYTRDGNACVVHVDSVNVYGLEAVTGIVRRYM